MRTLNLLRTQAFRIVLIYLGVFAVTAVGIVVFVYWNTSRVLDRQMDETIQAEVSGLEEQYERLGLPGLADVISARRGQGLYILASSNRRVIVGNLDSWPAAQPVGDGFIDFNYERRASGAMETRQARGKVYRLSQGFLLLVARDIHDRRQLESLFTTMLPWVVAFIVGFGIVGGLFISRSFLARLDIINSTSREIMSGDLSHRIPLTKAGDEFDDLSGHLNRMLDQIERLMHGMREVSDNVAHDLRTPLNRLRNHLELALSRENPESDTGRELSGAVEETDRLIATFNSLLLIAEAEAGSVRQSMQPTDLGDIIQALAELYGPVAEEKGVGLKVVTEDRAMIRGNRNLISQALANLLDNAIKYTQKGGEVSITLKDGAEPSVIVADNGPGIPEAERDRVTERFVRLETSRNSPGTGLGLSLVKAVARFHGAELMLDDNRPGLCATLQFPAAVKIDRAA